MFRQPSSGSAVIVGESDTFTFPFALNTGETITSASVTVSLNWGTDTAPTGMLNGSPSISGEYVLQTITPTVAGNIYTLTATATMSTGRILKNRMMFETIA